MAFVSAQRIHHCIHIYTFFLIKDKKSKNSMDGNFLCSYITFWLEKNSWWFFLFICNQAAYKSLACCRFIWDMSFRFTLTLYLYAIERDGMKRMKNTWNFVQQSFTKRKIKLNFYVQVFDLFNWLTYSIQIDRNRLIRPWCYTEKHT